MTVYNAGAALVDKETRRLWPRALRDGLVAGPVEAFLGAEFESRSLTAAAREFLDKIGRPMARMLLTFDEAVVEAFAAVSRRAIAEKWSRESYEAAITAAAAIAGATNFRASWAGAWYGTAILADSFNAAVVDKFRRQPTARLFPYLTVQTKRDDRVRPNHAHMDRFTAASTWPGWAYAAPPYGWNCRCILLPVSYVVAAASGFSGPFAGPSASKIATWPGPDVGFPKLSRVA